MRRLFLKRAGQSEIDQREDADDGEDDDAERSRQVIAVGPDRHFVDHAGEDVRTACEGRVDLGGTALGDHIDIAEIVEVGCEGGDNQRQAHLQGERQRDTPERMPAGCPLDIGHLVQGRRNRLQTAQADAHHEGEAQPDIDEDNPRSCPECIGHPGQPLGEAKRRQHLVDAAVLLVQQPLPGQQGDRRRQRPRDNEKRAVDLGFLHERIIEQYRQPQAGGVRQQRAEGGEDNCPQQHREEYLLDRAVQQRFIVFETDEVVCIQMIQVVVGKGDIDRVNDRQQRQEEDRQQGRRQIAICGESGIKLALVHLLSLLTAL